MKEDLSQADIIYCFLTPSMLKKLEDTVFKTLKKNTIIITNTFKFKNIKEIEIIQDKKRKLFNTVYIYKI